MSFIDEFLDMMEQEVVVTAGTLDAFGAFTAVSTVTYPCRIEGRRILTRDMAGREALSTVQVYIGDSVIDLSPDLHRYTLPSPWLPSGERVAIAVEPEFDESGPAFCVVYLP